MKGSVLIVGGGIAGTQAALDLADFGLKVYLLERDYAIGGTMAKLDKTFPTNDCSMCILSPKLVEAGRHKNIELITNAEIVGFEGKPGDYRIKIKEKPRFVDLEKCKGCGDCAVVCTVDLPNHYEEGLSKRKAIFRLYDQAVPSAFAVTKLGISPCRAACPIHVNAHGYVALIANRKFDEALKLVRERNPFPLITGRICTHPCEDACTRGRVDEPIAIDLLKRFVADREYKNLGEIPVPETPPDNGKKVAIVGAGPAGLLCAYDLRLKGYEVHVYDALDKPGGMLYVGIPAYRLPREILFEELSIVEKMGARFHFNTRIGTDIPFKKLVDDFDAVFVAVGAHRSKKLKVEGEDLPGVFGATEFLREINLGRKVEIGQRVVVIGGGNAAMDAARTLKRLGKDVIIAYRRTEKEMPANREEIEEAKEEGIEFMLLVTPKKILGKDRVEKIELIRMKLGEPDESGRRRPIPIEGSEFTIDVDAVVLAISQEPEIEGFEELEKNRWNTFEVDPETLQTNIDKVFAGGDCVTGPLTFIDAMFHGRKAAISIDRFLRGEDLHENREIGSYKSEIEVDTEGVPVRRRARPASLPLEKRKGFEEVVKGFTEKQAVEEAQRCLNCAGCCECFECLKACEADAIIHDMTERIRELEVGAVILSPGFDEFEPEILSEYGYGRFPNVVTSIQFERIMCASGPTKGEIVRLSDGKHARKIAWIQCVGSRNNRINRGYCSSVCCMYAVKEAVIAKEHAEDVEPTIFFMDIRSYGKDFDKYVERAEKEVGVRSIRARISHVEEDEDHNLILTYEDGDGKLVKEKFDLVVLSVGLEPARGSKELSEIFGIELNKYGFAKRDLFRPLDTKEAGVFVAGSFSSPKDIPETVAEASGASGKAMELLAPVRGTMIEEKELPPEIPVFNQPPRIAVFVCHCGKNIAGYLDVKAVVEYARTLPGVVHAEDMIYTCSQDAQERIKEVIKEKAINRVVVASCTPRTHEPLFMETIREAGLNKYLFEMANIRDQDSWVHMHNWEEATEKAKDLVRMAVFKARLLEPLQETEIPVNKNALVVGGGITGMTAALNLARIGHKVYLVEKEGELGGYARKIKKSTEGLDVEKFLKELIEEVERHPSIEVIKKAEIEKTEGYVGNFRTFIKNRKEPLEHGVIIVATGAEEYIPHEYMYGKRSDVLLQRELEEKLERGEIKDGATVVMIQCVGSRNDEHPWCSRICCSRAVRNAIDLQERGAQVYVLYRDIRTYGLREQLYTEAREKGVVFIRYEKGKEPAVDTSDGKLRIRTFDPILRTTLEFEPDYLVLSNGIVPRKDNELLSRMFKVPLNEDGFFLEAHMKLRPVDFATDGVFLAGLAHSPKFIDESIVQAKAAAARAAIILAKDHLTTAGITAKVNELKCIGCGLCSDVCPYSAVSLVEKKVLGRTKLVAEVNPVLCKGCGACTASCRPGAIDLRGFTNDEILHAEFALVAEEKKIEKLEEAEKILEEVLS